MEVIIDTVTFETLLKRIDGLYQAIEELKRIISVDERLYNITESAKIMGISKPTLHKYIRLGLIEYKLVGNTTYFTRDLIEKFISKRE
jgi:hypothetical protein